MAVCVLDRKMIKTSDLNQMPLKQIKAEIAWRRDSLNYMVGNLYPSIVLDEIGQLEERKRVIEQILKNEVII